MDEKEMKNILRSAQNGDAHAFGELYAFLAEDAYRFALYYLKNTHDAQDAVQETSLKAWVRLKTLRKPEAFRTWFFKILSNVCKESLSALKAVTPAEVLPDVAGGEDMTVKTELKELLLSLPEKDRELIILSVAAGFSSREISEITGMNANTVRSRLSRALHALRAQIEPEVSAK